MIPVLIVLGSAAASAAGLFVGAAATAAAHEVVQESKDELNAINADMQKMTEDATTKTKFHSRKHQFDSEFVLFRSDKTIKI